MRYYYSTELHQFLIIKYYKYYFRTYCYAILFLNKKKFKNGCGKVDKEYKVSGWAEENNIVLCCREGKQGSGGQW